MSDVPVLPAFWDGGPPAVDPTEAAPSVDDVAELLRTRTVESGGSEAGTFTNTTYPTATEAAALIDQAVDEVLAALPLHADPMWYPAIRAVCATRAAALIELSFYRDSTLASPMTPGATWTVRWAAGVAELQQVIPNWTLVA
jgi:hypothetical protein